MNAFLFQAVRKRYDLAVEIRPGRVDDWKAVRYRTRLQLGDFVYLWQAGDDTVRGLYGWGTLVREAYYSQTIGHYAVDVKYDERFSNPILATEISSDPQLANLSVFGYKNQTIFPVSPKEAKALEKLVTSKGEIPPHS